MDPLGRKSEKPIPEIFFRMQFATVIRFGDEFYLRTEQYVGGPRTSQGPLRKIGDPFDKLGLGLEIVEALNEFKVTDLIFSPEDWEIINQRFNDFFGVKSTRAYHRKAREATIRREQKKSGETEYLLFDSSGEEFPCGATPLEIGRSVLTMLGSHRR